jgi:hypothetical protein
MRQKIFFFMFLMLIGSVATAAELEEYDIDDVGQVKMSYRYEGVESPYRFAQVDISGSGEVVCSFQYSGTNFVETSNLQLQQSDLGSFIQEYAKLKFLDYDFKKITDSSDNEHRIYDAGYNNLSFQDKNRNKKVSYQIIKTKSAEGVVVPINEDALVLSHLQKMYGSIISQKVYLYELKNYKNSDKGVLANLLSSIGADAGKRKIIAPKEFVPLIMEIIRSKEMRDSIGQYAAGTLEAIIGEKPAGDWWDCNKWLMWWEKNKNSYAKN